MKLVFCLPLFFACVFCLFANCKLDSEVFGTYDIISDGYVKNQFHSISQKDKNQVKDQLKPSQLIMENTSSSSPRIQETNSSQAQAIHRFPLINYDPSLARKLGLSTLMMSGVLYGISMLPAIIALTASGAAGPLAGFFNQLGRRKRSLVNESHIFRQLPLLNNEESFRFLSLFESTLTSRKVQSSSCKLYYLCKVYHNVLKSGESPTLATFENAILNVFGIAVERKDLKIYLVPTIKMYYSVAKDALKGEVSCARKYPCTLQSRNHPLLHLLTQFTT